jgi:hypothetical protein
LAGGTLNGDLALSGAKLGILQTVPKYNLHVEGSIGFSHQVVFPNATYNVANTDNVLLVMLSNGNGTIQLPEITTSIPSVEFGRVLTIILAQPFGNALTIEAASGEVIVGTSTLVMANVYESVTLFSGDPTGTPAWYILSRNP